ncbi:MAG TPA: hypothetical protein VN517_08325 [Terriglobales bacterium]|nr:hypothetical protein [Terriglobales bacterium]
MAGFQVITEAKTYHIRQIFGVPVKSPSFWIKDLHITVQFAAVNGMWYPFLWTLLRRSGFWAFTPFQVVI